MSIVTIAEVKALGRITTMSQDSLLQTLIDSAESFVESFCDVSLVNESHTESIDGGDYYLRPSIKPLTEVTSITEDTEVLDVGDYAIENFGIYQSSEIPWDAGKKKFLVVYNGGFEEVPAGLLLAVKQMALRAYMNFEAKEDSGDSGVSTSWQSLWNGNDIKALLEQYSHKTVLD